MQTLQWFYFLGIFYLLLHTTLDLFHISGYTYFTALYKLKHCPDSLPFSQIYFSLLYVHVSRGYVLPLVKKEDTLFFFIIFSQVATLRSILALSTARIIVRGWRPAQHFQDIYWLREHRNLEYRGKKAICKLQYRHSDIVAHQHW